MNPELNPSDLRTPMCQMVNALIGVHLPVPAANVGTPTSVVHYMFEGGPIDAADDVPDTGLTAGSRWFSKKNSSVRQAHAAQHGVRAAYIPSWDR